MNLRVIILLVSTFCLASSAIAQQSDSSPKKIKENFDSIGTRRATGSLPKREIRRVVKSNRDKFRYCWESIPDVKSTDKAFVKIKFVIKPDGKVQSNRVLINSSGHRELGDCMTEVVLKMQFPKPKGRGFVIVAYPFNFSFFERPEFEVKVSALSPRSYGWLWSESLLHDCYSTLRAKKFAWGSVDFRFSINKNGKVEALTVKAPPELNDIDFTKCIHGAAQTWEFSRRNIEITKSISFESTKDDPEAIKKIRISLNKFVKENRTCMENVSKDRKLVLKITVTSAAKVTKIKKIWGTIKSNDVQACVEKQLRAWAFPSTGSTVSITYPFVGTGSKI